MAHNSNKEMAQLFEHLGWSEVTFRQDDFKFWGFQEGAVMPTPIPKDVVNKVLGAGYAPPYLDYRGLARKMAVCLILLLAIDLSLSALPFFIPGTTLYRVTAINVESPNTSPAFETYRRPFGIGSTTYLMCNGGIQTVSGDVISIEFNAGRGKITDDQVVCK